MKYIVGVNDDVFEIITDHKMRTEEIAAYLECDIEEIVQVDLEEVE